MLPPILSETDRLALFEATSVYRYDEDMRGPLLVPVSPLLEDSRSVWEERNPQVFIEILSLLQPSSDEVWDMLEFYNILRGVRSISGLSYLPSSGGPEKPLFTEVFRVADLRGREKLPDDRVVSIPPEESFLVHMREVNLGRGVYRFEYRSDGSDVRLSIINQRVMRSLIKVLDPQGMEIRLTLIPVDEGLLSYMSCAVHIQNERTVRRVLSPFGYFHNRLRILYKWFRETSLGPDAREYTEKAFVLD